MNNYLFILQNDTHAKNFSVLINDINDAKAFDVVILDNVTKLKTDIYFANHPKLENINFIYLPNVSEQSFYLAKAFTRMKIVNKIISYLTAHSLFNTEGYDYIYLGNDGAIQKVLLKYISKRNEKSKVILMVDGFLTKKKGVKQYIKRCLSRCCDALSLSHYFPSEIGMCKKIDHIIVMHSSVKEILVFYGVPPNKIEISLLPRHRKLADLKINKNFNKNGPIKVLYVATAYMWHSLEREHKSQVEQIIQVKKLISPNVNLTIRMHPRDNLQFYPDGFWNNLNISNVSLEDDLMEHDLIISSRSSAIFDAILSGCSVAIYNEFFEHIAIESPFDTLPVCNNIIELNTLIGNLK